MVGVREGREEGKVEEKSERSTYRQHGHGEASLKLLVNFCRFDGLAASVSRSTLLSSVLSAAGTSSK